MKLTFSFRVHNAYMSVIQSKQKDLRFLKRKNLEEEARIYGNMLADQIHQYGVDCIYHKMNTDVFGDFKGIVDRNAMLKHAYKGYDLTPDYTCSANMITFPEVQADIFQLNKYGIANDVEVDFHFDAKQFACDLATKCGQLKEYPIKEICIECEVPDCLMHYEMLPDAQGNLVSTLVDDSEEAAAINANVFPYNLGLGYKENYECGILKGKLSVHIDGYEYGIEQTVVCNPYEHTDFKVSFPKNSDLYKSLTYEICNDEYLDTLIYLTFTVSRLKVGNNEFKNVLVGKIHGSVLFYDLNKIGKYLDLIHPEVGDVITIDFPDDANREKYKITDCYDKSLQPDGISPLLHKYIWKCKAKRYVESYEENAGLELNESDARLEEKIKHDLAVEEEVAKTISKYDEGDQEAYGGYDGVTDNYDKQAPSPYKHERYDYLADGTCLDIMSFSIGSKLITNGYDLIFVNTQGDGYIVAKMDHEPVVRDAYFESGLRWLKATDRKIVFVNIEGQATALAEDEVATQNEVQMCLNDLNEKTLDVGEINAANQNFLKFKGTRSYIWSDGNSLFAKLQSNQQLYKLV